MLEQIGELTNTAELQEGIRVSFFWFGEMLANPVTESIQMTV